ncbi:Chanoclavine-I aldehyde reductase fgaOx3 [Cladobotryum mycophilum]|uniref:Chanoclavine-I aldehyde reductase fgaOx3 n=1 Tax=Cladobotryum mycophilum TaxID=491253 RepID=A0ABR0S4E2_9HYPO
MTAGESKLWQPLKVGNLTLSHRLVMAPLTRYRNGDNHEPLDLMVQYYADRACVPGSLIITEATGISGAAEARPNLPGIWTEEEIAGWKRVYEGVHARGSFVFQQLWDLGRGGSAEYVTSRGYKYGSSGDVKLKDSPVPPEPLTEEEIWQKIGEYRKAARNVIDAGGDGVEIHGAHGYLVDQFTRDSANNRTDKWGGSVENRSRFLIEVVKAVTEEIGAERTGLRISPFATYQSSYSSDTWEQTTDVVRRLKEGGYKLAYLSIVEPRGDPGLLGGPPPPDHPQPFTKTKPSLDFLLKEWNNFTPIVVGGGYDANNSEVAVDGQYKPYDVAVAIGRHFISNPDLVFKVKNKIPFTPYIRETFYLPKSPVGYNDYPFSKEAIQAGLVPSVAN